MEAQVSAGPNFVRKGRTDFDQEMPVGRAIFISYRRDDSEGETGRLFDDLVRSLGEDSVFMDVAGINPGIDFRKAIDDNVATCGVLLAVIGPRWVTVTDSGGRRRLDDENDFVRLETASALARNIPVIPVLVHEAKMPSPSDLPEGLKDLAYRNSVELTHARWNSDVQLLTTALRQYVDATPATDKQPVHATVPVQLPAPNAVPPPVAAAGESKMPMMVGIGAAVLLLLGVVAFFAFRQPANRNGRSVATPPPVLKAGSSGSVAGGKALISGTWANPSPEASNALAKLEISDVRGRVSMHAWGKCSDCDWGVQTTTFDGQQATAVWTFAQSMGKDAEGRQATVTVAPNGAGLMVNVVNAFPKRPPVEKREEFVRTQ